MAVIRPGEEPPPEQAGQAAQSARMFQAVFASYSHADTRVVEAMETACKALGMDYLRDVMTLKSGQSWSDELLGMIERADVFQLFWSDRARRSAYVEQEWRHALSLADRKGGAFIRPIYWQQPLPAVPAALSHLHFAPVELPPLQPVPGVERAALVPGRFEDLLTLTVSTYAAVDAADPATARLRARTRVSLTGDTEVVLAAGAVDPDLVSLHERMVAEALRTRLAYLQLATGGKPR